MSVRHRSVFQNALIFVTGAVILALQLLASRIMTPFFGVSLYIWTGILAITLTFLALGYHLGGTWSRKLALENRSPDIRFLYHLMPLISGLAIGMAAFLYPTLLPAIAAMNVLTGSIVGCFLLLAAPLLLMSAMNPLLVALRQHEADGKDGGAGAGTVFFISTMGSVAGVFLAALLLIPHFSNHSSMVGLGTALALTCLLPLGTDASSRARRPALWMVGILGLLCNLGALISLSENFSSLAELPSSGFHIVESRPSAFGNLKVVDMKAKPAEEPFQQRILINEGILQNGVLPDGRSSFEFTWALETIGLAYAPDAKRALVLGAAAGVVPMRLRQQGLDVAIVEINPAMIDLAQKYFGFHPDGMTLTIEDARLFVQKCQPVYDLVVLDLFQGDGVPEQFVTSNFFHDVRSCIKPGGVAVMNSFGSAARPKPLGTLLASLGAAFPALVKFESGTADDDHLHNIYIAALTTPPPKEPVFRTDDIPAPLVSDLASKLAKAVKIETKALPETPVTDNFNTYPFTAWGLHMQYRQDIVRTVPPRLLIN